MFPGILDIQGMEVSGGIIRRALAIGERAQLAALGDELAAACRNASIDVSYPMFAARMAPYPGGVYGAAERVLDLPIAWIDNGLCDKRGLASALELQRGAALITGLPDRAYAGIATVQTEQFSQTTLLNGWRWHEAPTILSSSSRQVVLDPMLSDTPLDLADWARMSAGGSAHQAPTVRSVMGYIEGTDSPIRQAIAELLAG